MIWYPVMKFVTLMLAKVHFDNRDFDLLPSYQPQGAVSLDDMTSVGGKRLSVSIMLGNQSDLELTLICSNNGLTRCSRCGSSFCIKPASNYGQKRSKKL